LLPPPFPTAPDRRGVRGIRATHRVDDLSTISHPWVGGRSSPWRVAPFRRVEPRWSHRPHHHHRGSWRAVVGLVPPRLVPTPHWLPRAPLTACARRWYHHGVGGSGLLLFIWGCGAPSSKP
jgi:hypothetical protein